MVDFNYDYDYSDIFDDIIDSATTTSYTPPSESGELNMPSYSDIMSYGIGSILPSNTSFMDFMGTFDDYGYGATDEDYVLPAPEETTDSSAGTEEASATETGIFGGTLGPKLKDMFGGLLGILGLGDGNFLNTILGQREGGGFGSGNPLIDYLMMKSLLKDQGGSGGAVPVGQQAYGQAQPFSYQAYQPTNLQPALMPGVAYANVGAPGMMDGGEAKQYPNKGLAALAKEAPEVVKRMGYKDGGSIMNRPGDITFAKLEPGEFVIRREAVDAVGIPTLEQINAMGG